MSISDAIEPGLLQDIIPGGADGVKPGSSRALGARNEGKCAIVAAICTRLTINAVKWGWRIPGAPG